MALPPIIKCLILRSSSASFGTFKLSYTCIGTIAAHTGACVKCCKGRADGSTTFNFKLHSTALTTIIMPPIWFNDKHNRASSLGFSCKKLQVFLALSRMSSFKRCNCLGFPVEPLVCTTIVLLSLCHNSKNSSSTIIRLF